ncbi:MAG: hypothetical protein H6874_01870 [Hyphomicrobiaceae bacterium]|nr:hypothetical protein [Hyphomicrobiaceae bacterium]
MGAIERTALQFQRKQAVPFERSGHGEPACGVGGKAEPAIIFRVTDQNDRRAAKGACTAMASPQRLPMP